MAKNDEPQSVYAMLGFADHKSMEVKSRLAQQIFETIKRRRIEHADAASLVGMPQQDLSNMLRGQFRGISKSKMMDCLAALGKSAGR